MAEDRQQMASREAGSENSQRTSPSSISPVEHAQARRGYTAVSTLSLSSKATRRVTVVALWIDPRPFCYGAANGSVTCD